MDSQLARKKLKYYRALLREKPRVPSRTDPPGRKDSNFASESWYLWVMATTSTTSIIELSEKKHEAGRKETCSKIYILNM